MAATFKSSYDFAEDANTRESYEKMAAEKGLPEEVVGDHEKCRDLITKSAEPVRS